LAFTTPLHPLAIGVTVIVAVTGALVVFVPVNAAILPVPVAARPIDVVLFVQLNVVPATVPLKVVAATKALLHTVWFEGCATVGVGFTVIVNACEEPTHELAEGVTVIVAITGAVVALVAVKAPIELPVPALLKPIEVVLLAQANVVPATAPLKVTTFVEVPLHTV
jgi:hypothetical protein